MKDLLGGDTSPCGTALGRTSNVKSADSNMQKPAGEPLWISKNPKLDYVCKNIVVVLLHGDMAV